MAIPVIARGPIPNMDLFIKFAKDVPTWGNGEPLDPILNYDVFVDRQMYHGEKLKLPPEVLGPNDQEWIEVWGFEDPKDKDGLTFPSKPVRMTEGQLFWGHLSARHGPHTIHWHGIEPTPCNDGVGHFSFEVTGNYTYQWLATEAGTYFYHCHRNTLVHFEYGMYGGLIIDPPNGPGWVRRGDEQIQYDVEGVWVSDEMDPRWHLLDKSIGIDTIDPVIGFDPVDRGLHIFEPKYFLITGVPHPWTKNGIPGDYDFGEYVRISDVRVTARVGQTILIRVICGGYTQHSWSFDLDGEVIAFDARTLGRNGSQGGPTPRGAYSPYSQPYILPAGTPIELSSARRFDILFRPTVPGRYPCRVEFRHANKGYEQRHIESGNVVVPGKPEVIGIAETYIDVLP